MPNTKSAIRTQRKQDRKRLMNLSVVRAYKLAVREFRKSPSEDKLVVVYKALDKAAKRKVITKNKAARLKSRLAKSLRSNVRKSKSPTQSSK